MVIPLIGYFVTPSFTSLTLVTASTTNFEKKSSFLFFLKDFSYIPIIFEDIEVLAMLIRVSFGRSLTSFFKSDLMNSIAFLAANLYPAMTLVGWV
jgi:hypothetical protein